ncbi:tRNA pseudouridine(55) synthase TruB [Pararhodospirillum oryzae]|uniref:tRNA pseudouridine synthase B n=1 Tax=Pararhodospirillum oryzae TaxID=478448 RepID=A0A512HA65_9PROT|nr:tRNA pseudouridine(55) synthase TruB [Pararhodospirillum oryzae]GEO82329.1 tRNA pseudouridine synthase B [Pararhodospirillum oryzae]
MSRRRGRPVHGWLAIDKPLGVTSTDVVSMARRVTGAAKVGHGGTLDPLASGVLPLAFGEATKTVAYVMDGTKVYEVCVAWGEARDTDDREGEVTQTSPVRPTRAAIEAMLPRFTGTIEQVPPAYSAVKVDGKRAYALARADAPVILAPRPVRIDSLSVLDCPTPDEAVLRVVSGKGTYMRALARDLALALGTCGHVKTLRRLSCGPFRAESAISLEDLAKLGQDDVARCLLPIEAALDDIPAVPLIEEEARRLSQGQALSLLSLASRTPVHGLAQGEAVQALCNGKVVALARVAGAEIRPMRVINL